MKEFINKFIQEKNSLYFISPHLDDAALSCGGLIEYLVENYQTKVFVVSVFAGEPSPPYSLSGKAFLKQCKKKDAKILFNERKNEDIKAFEKFGIHIAHLDFADALWRKKVKLNFFEKILGKILSDFLHIYPTYRWHVISGKISHLEGQLLDSIKKSLLQIIDNNDKSTIFCPVGIGNHVDHIITRKCCLENFDNVILWSDFPYNEKNTTGFIDNDYEEIIFHTDQEKKRILIESYESQFQAMFPEGITNISKERYYLKKGNIQYL